jgi:uncharacterized membrane-anchored protein YjiN (DUF445 family)
MDRENILNVLQAEGRKDDDLKDSVCVKWVVVMDWMSPDGTRTIQRVMSENMTGWEREGLLHTALFGNWR